MELLTEELRAELPKLYAQEGTKDPIVYAKFFFPAGRWTWFATEGQQEEEDFIFFGYVIGDFEEWGNFSLNELQSVNVYGLTVERDLYFKQGPFSEVLARFRKERGE
jgi:flavodoxin